MKFKKIEISAFRIYDDPQDATFDLMATDGTPAGFVSLYAPNGFGKTSFYDAVEFGITKSINRFYIRSKELEKLANFQRTQNDQSLIRNTNSAPERNTYVKIFTDQGDEPINAEFKKHGNQIHDLNFNRDTAHDFQKVILSQEWISAFLTERDGEYRYSKFMDAPDFSEINSYYTNVKHLIGALEIQKETLSNTISEYEQLVKETEDENVLEIVNYQIDSLNLLLGADVFGHLGASMTQQDIQRIQDRIDSTMVENDNEANLNYQLSLLSGAVSGTAETVSLSQYGEVVNAVKFLRSHLDATTVLLGYFEALDNNAKRNEEIDFSIQYLLTDLSRVQQSLDDFARYMQITSDISKIQGDIEIAATDLGNCRRSVDDYRSIDTDLKADLQVKIGYLERLAERKAKIPEIKLELEVISAELESKETDFNLLRGAIEDVEKSIENVNRQILFQERLEREIAEGDYVNLRAFGDALELEILSKIEHHQNKIFLENANLEKVTYNVNQQSSLNASIVKFIQSGLELVGQRSLTSCPLCDQVYETHEKLIEQITQNKALDDSIKSLLQQQTELEEKISGYSRDLAEEQLALLNDRMSKLAGYRVQNQRLTTNLAGLLEKRREAENVIEALKNRKDYLNTDLGGLNIVDFAEYLERSIVENRELSESVTIRMRNNEALLNAELGKLDAIQKSISILDESLSIQKRDEVYMRVLGEFDYYFPGRDKVKLEFETKKAELQKAVDDKAILKTELRINKERLEREISGSRKEELLEKRIGLEKELQANQDPIVKYLAFLHISLGIEGNDAADISTKIDEKILEYQKQLDRSRELNAEFIKLKLYSQNVWPFLQSEDAKKKVEEARLELNFLINNVQPQLETERDKAQEYLKSRIKTVFHQDLINSLYRKIDPHPDFKSVEFVANFESDNPRLDVFVKNDNGENFLIPNLYFSTAQINILSLSIFLASALCSEEYKCIFIDDPIQSMDSINVLSTIDLLRSIMINENRQIILSTHDKSFHNLLRKKIPPDRFKSKFLELETFGKVKQVD